MQNQQLSQGYGSNVPKNAPPGAQTYRNEYTTDQGHTKVKEEGYSNTQNQGGVTTHTNFQSSSRTTTSDPVVTRNFTSSSSTGNQIGNNQGYTQSGNTQGQNQTGSSKQVTTEYTTYTSGGQGYTSGAQGYNNTGAQGLTTSTYSTTGLNQATGSGRIISAETGARSSFFNKPVLSGQTTTTTYGNTGNRIETSGIETYGQRNSQYGASRTSVISKGAYIVGEKEHEGRLVSESQGEKRVVEIREGQQVTKSETVTFGEKRVVREVEMQSTTRQVDESINLQRTEKDVEIVKRDKIIEVVKEVPFRVEKFVDRKIDIIVDVPIERTYEREKITEVVVERPIEKIVEIPIEQIIEIPVEKIIEKPVEIQKFVEVPKERIIEKPYDVIKENIIWRDRVVDIDEKDIRKYGNSQVLDLVVDYQEKQKYVDRPKYVDNIIEKEVRVPREVYIDVPKEKIIENRVKQVIDQPRHVDKVIKRDVDVHKENIVYKDVPYITERPRYVENIIEKPVPVERVIEKEVLVPVDHRVEKKVVIEQIEHRPKEIIVQVPVAREEYIEEIVEQLEEVPLEIEQVVERPVEKIIRKSVPVIRQVQVPVEFIVEKLVEKKVDVNTEVVINKYAEVPVEKIVEKPVYIERIVEVAKYIDKIIEVPVERIVEKIKTVEKIIEKPVYIETVLEKEVEVIKERIVEVEVEKLVEVEVEILVETPVYEEIFSEEIINLEAEVGTGYDNVSATNENVEYEDTELATQIKLRTQEIEGLKVENRNLRSQYEQFQSELQTLRSKISNVDEQDNGRLKATIEELNTRIRVHNEQHTRLVRKSTQRNTVIETQVNKDPRVEQLKSRIHQLILENQRLVSQITNKGEFVRKSLRKSVS
jgi:hypothetical protein